MRTLETRKSTCLAALAMLVLVSTAAQATAEEPVPAVWRERRLSFQYNSSLAIYTCDALQGRVADLMRAVGARDDVRVNAHHCDDSMAIVSGGNVAPRPWGAARPMSQPSLYAGQRPDATQRRFVVVTITAMVPTQVTPDVLAELEKDKERRELIARVSGNPAARFNDPVIFAAERQQVTLSRRTLDLQPEECELVEQMATTVFRELGVDIVRRNGSCDRTRQSQLAPELVVESLMAAKPKPPPVDDAEDDGAAEPAPAEPPEAPAPPPSEQ